MGDAMSRLRRNAGFTLLELMMVVAIIGIGAAVTGFSIRGMLPDLRLKAAVRDMMSDMNAARLRAIRENSRVVMGFDTAANSYTVFIDDGGGTPANAANNTLDAGETVVKTVAMPLQVEMYEVAMGAATWVRFNGQGWPNVGGNVHLRNSDDNYRGVVVSMAGKVRVSESYDGGTTWN
jgi:type IV fimbrial biogenesis protein FimT